MKKWFIKFERQGYDELVAVVEAETEDEAYNKAAWVFLGNVYDIFPINERQAYVAECPVIGEDLSEYDFDDDVKEDNEDEK